MSTFSQYISPVVVVLGGGGVLIFGDSITGQGDRTRHRHGRRDRLRLGKDGCWCTIFRRDHRVEAAHTGRLLINKRVNLICARSQVSVSAARSMGRLRFLPNETIEQPHTRRSNHISHARIVWRTKHCASQWHEAQGQLAADKPAPPGPGAGGRVLRRPLSLCWSTELVPHRPVPQCRWGRANARRELVCLPPPRSMV